MNNFKTSRGVFITQGLFLEQGYRTDLAVFTFADEDREYKGKPYISLKKLYLELMDVNEYTFATTYLGGWHHWQRLCANRLIRVHIDAWREELELKLASLGFQEMLTLTRSGDRPASKWMAEKGFKETRKVGRPRKEDVAREAKRTADLDEEVRSMLDSVSGLQ
jgi:hypothetical protein